MKKPKRPAWTLARGAALARTIEATLGGMYHVTLGGSVLLRGWSNKDLDLFVYPHDASILPPPMSYGMIRNGLRAANLTRTADIAAVQEIWRRAGSKDTKAVEVWRTEDGKRVDVFYVR